jgi:hypothetical protein
MRRLIARIALRLLLCAMCAWIAWRFGGLAAMVGTAGADLPERLAGDGPAPAAPLQATSADHAPFKKTAPAALHFKHWAEREIALPARRVRARLVIRPDTPEPVDGT